MQAATPTYLAPPQNGYQPLSEAEIYAVKRQYLRLLPPQQVIDICLTFEAHAPLHIKSSVWPYDIRAAITSIQAQKAQAPQTLISSEPDGSLKTPTPGDSSSGEKTTASQLSVSHQATSAPTQAGPSTNTPSSPQPTPSQSAIPSATPGPHYPHHPYYHPTYPHAPYYTSSHTPYGYPPPYPLGMYPVNPTSHHPPLFTNAPLVHPPHSTQEQSATLNNVDDLPSYEEMIVEALLDSGDPEGCVPKSLFSWMAMHYPLQTNFRPSASQALQKAYKRGRLEKGSNGKYRLNENWEGGNTSRRTTRRPQTLAQSAFPGQQGSSSSPFTHAPLVPHGTGNLQTHLPPPGQPPGYGGYSFGYPYQGTSGSVPGPVARDIPAATSQKQAAGIADHETGEGSDAWEAAQNILKAINFGQLFQISNEENKAGAPSSSGDSRNQATAGGPDNLSSTSAAIVVEESTVSHPDGVAKSTELNVEQRAALQAQLALLAAQLAELADVGEDELSHNLEVSQRTVVMSDAHMPSVLGEGLGAGDNSDDDNEEMVEVPVPIASHSIAKTHDLPNCNHP